jgi:hypothetical protein
MMTDTSATTTLRYPMLAHLTFCPGGIIATKESKRHSLLQAQAQLVQDALHADLQLVASSNYCPSLSVLAEAVFGRLTGCAVSSTKEWAELMILTYAESELKATSVAALLQTAARTVSAKPNRGPCGYVFQRGDIAWNCRSCQTDPTCVMCDACFHASNHEGHEVYFHRTSPGGCCDCGDAEAWAMQGCCDLHRPEQTERSDPTDPMEAVKMSNKGLQQGELCVTESGLPKRLLAAFGVVIGAAVHAITEAVDGAALGADPTQWRIKWAEEAARIVNGTPFSDDVMHSQGNATPATFLEGSNTLPEGYVLQLRLHNDDVHTFDEVIDALHEPRQVRRHNNEPNITEPANLSLVPDRTRATDMTHHVDADGQVTVKTYSTVAEAMRGFRRLKSRGLHCDVVSSAQVQMELRARALVSWLSSISQAHPAIAAIVVHALVQVDADHDIAGIQVWRRARFIPIWAGMDARNEQEMLQKRFQFFPPYLISSYLTREESELLLSMAFSVNPGLFCQLTGAPHNFYDNILWRLPSDRYKKSPHALWGTLPSVYSGPLMSKHPLLQMLETGMIDPLVKNTLTEDVYVIDTDFRKQQEADRITTSVFPHKLPGLYMISGVGTVRLQELDARRPALPSAMELRNLLVASSFRSPLSPILLLLLLDPYPTKQLRSAIHALMLSLLTDSRFRCRFAGAVGVAYRPLTTLFCAGVGTEADTPLHFTVQIFTAGSLIRALGNALATEKLLVSDRHDNVETPQASIGVFVSPIAHTIARCIHTNLLGATKEVNMILNNTSSANDDNSQDDSHLSRNESLLPSLTYVAGEHPLITPLPAAPDDGFLDSRSTRHKRLPHILRDLEYVIETPGTAIRLLLSNRFPLYQGPIFSAREEVLSFAAIYARMLRLAQGMDTQKRKISGGHVEYEQNRWLEAFGLSLNFAGTRDALAESSISSANVVVFGQGEDDGSVLLLTKEATGNVIASLLREIKLWLYREGMLETGLPISPHGSVEVAQAEALQRSTLHVSNYSFVSESDASLTGGSTSAVALACATGVKMSETNLTLIENALKAEAAEKELSDAARGSSLPRLASFGPVMGDWLRVPHSPLAGDALSFHLPLHRALAKCVKSLCGVMVPDSVRGTLSTSWWKIPVLDCETSLDPSTPMNHPLVPIIQSTLRYQNCRIAWTGGPDCSAQEAQRRKGRSRAVSANIAVTKVLHSLADHPIRCIAAAQQIERHLWARNGSSVAGMAMNYSSTPLCRSFRDLDLLLVQLSAAGMSCGLGARRVFSLLVNRFSLDGYLCDPERRTVVGSSSGGAYGPGLSMWVKPPRLLDPDHALVLSESFFSTLCVIVSELPPPPPFSLDDDSSLRQTVRRELLHALAAEPRSHSEAMTAATGGISRREETEGSSGGNGGAAVFRDVFSEVLGELAKQKTQTSSRAASGPPSYELKSDFCDEYDPSFFHLRRQEHQHAMDLIARLRKQKFGADKYAAEEYCFPLVCPPPKAHPRFLPSRLLLHLPALDAALRRSLLFALTGGSWLPPSEPVPVDASMSVLQSDDLIADPTAGIGGSTYNADAPLTSINRRFLHSHSSGAQTVHLPRRILGADSVPFSKDSVAASSVSFSEVLQLLTLQVHTLEACASLHRLLPDLDDESRLLSAGLSINSYLRRLVSVPESLTDVWALKPYPDGPLQSKGTGERRGSLLGLLIALYEHRADHAAISDGDGADFGKSDDDHGGARSLATSGLKWLLRFVNALVDGASSVGAATKSATTGVPIRIASISGSPSNAGFESSSWTIDSDVRSNISDMLHGLLDLWPKERESSSPSADKTSSKNKEARKAAQLRVLENMKMKQVAFARTIAPSEQPVAEEGSGDNESDLCIICRCDDADGENNGPLGYLGHIQRSRVTQMRACTEASDHDGPRQMLFNSYRVVGHMGCQLRESEAMDSKPLSCLPKGSVVTIMNNRVSTQYDVSSRRVKVHHTTRDPITGASLATEGWASVRSSQGYIILSPLASICYTNSAWGGTRPIVKMCGHAAHLKVSTR